MRQRVPRVAAGTYLAVAFGDMYRSGNNKMTRVFLLDAMRNYVCLWLLCPLLFSPSKLHRVLRIL